MTMASLSGVASNATVPPIDRADAPALAPEQTTPPPPPPPLHARHRRHTGLTLSPRVVGGVSKRIFDIAVATGALIVLSPALVAVWTYVRIESPGPGLFRQRRGGFEGRPFHIYKFRTMRTCESRTVAQAKQDDDRTTKCGKFLRKFSIDELPQLLNVVIGDMSLIGPRPHALAHDKKFVQVDRRYAFRHRARPGITGLAQVSGSRGPTDTEAKIIERLNYDLEYVTNWSWKMDASIFLRTIKVLLSDRTAF